MSYKSNSELPDSVKNVLPEHAKEIYRKAFNNAWEQYKNPSDRKKGASHEETSHKVAWNAVKKGYKKSSNDKWEKK